MSYLCFGEFGLSGPLDGQVLQQLSWRLLKHGADQDICLLLGCNIPQPDVFEVLGVEKSAIPTSALPFLATASPLEDTSDSLLGPDTLVVVGLGTDMQEIERSLRRLQALFGAVLRESAVQTVTFYITEGFDTEFIPVLASVSEFHMKAASILRENDNWWPSLKFIVRRDAAA